MLRTHLGQREKKVETEACQFRLVAYGPILRESKKKNEHYSRRDLIAAAEKALAEAMTDAGYEVMNHVRCRREPDEKLSRQLLAEFAKHFPRLTDAN